MRFLALLLIASSAAAAPRFERDIVVAGQGPQRLAVDVALLAGAASDLRDLRIYDPSNREVPHLLVGPSGKAPDWARTRRFQITPTKTTSGIEVDLRGRRLIDALRIENVAGPVLKRVRIEGSGDRDRWILLADTTVFDLPADNLKRMDIEFQAAELRYLRLVWDDAASAPVPSVPSVLVRVHDSAVPPAVVRGEVSVVRRKSEPGKSRYHIDLPGTGLPIRAVVLSVPRGDVFREAVISEPRLAGSEIVPVTLGRAQLRQAERDGLLASAAGVPISAPLSQELDIAIDDGANAPLDVKSATLELDPQPWIYFEAQAPGTFKARFGDANAQRPRYDLEAARPFLARASLADATWAASKRVASSSASTATAAPLPTIGAAIDPSRFRISRPVAAASRGMAVLKMDADVLSRSRELADVRLVDAGGRQVPFIVEHRNEPMLVDLRLHERRLEGENDSAYTLDLPHPRVPAGSRLVVTTTAGVFEREVVLRETGTEDGEPRVVASSTWRHSVPESQAPPLTFNLPARSFAGLELNVAEGDNAPLPLAGAQLVLPSYALRFYHPGGPLTLLYGNAEVSAPRYDLALLAPRLFGEPAQTVSFATGAVGENGSEPGIERHFFWLAIAAIALVLMLLLARLLRPLAQSDSR